MKFNELCSGEFFKPVLPKDVKGFMELFGSSLRNDLTFKKLDMFHAVSQSGRIEHFHLIEPVEMLPFTPDGWPEGL